MSSILKAVALRLGTHVLAGPAPSAVTGTWLSSRVFSRPAHSAVHSSDGHSAGTQVSTLPSGLRVATERMPGETATVGVWLDTGSRFETDVTNGTAHFVEHMAFKGTQKRTRDSLELEVENMGGHLNAYTSREQTVYFAKVMKADVGHAIDILSDILQNSTLEESAIERERGVILREMEEVESHEEEVVFDKLHEVAYRGTPLARTILGPAENVRRIQRSDLLEYVGARYHPKRMVLAASGNVDHSAMCDMAENTLKAGDANTSYPGSLEGATPSQFLPGEVHVPEDEAVLSHVAVALEGVSWTSVDYFTMALMQVLLGNYDGISGLIGRGKSRLASRLAEKDLAQSVMSFNTCYSDTGLFGFYGVTLPEKTNSLAKTVISEWVRLCYEVDDDQVKRAQQQLKASILMSLDGTSPVCEDIGRQMLVYNRHMPISELCARIDLVTPDHIRAAAIKRVFGRSPAVVVLGPSAGLKDVASFEDMSGWLQQPPRKM